MVDFEGVTPIIEGLDAAYTDIRFLKRTSMEIAVRRESIDFYESRSERVVCRAVSNGYGIASTDKTDLNSIREISRLAPKFQPMISNVYIKPSDWGKREMFQETGKGIYVEGIVRAETDTTTGTVELVPEIAYTFQKEQKKKPLKNLRIIGSIGEVLQDIDAVGESLSVRPGYEKGFAVSEGSPQIRIRQVTCY